MSPHVAEIHKAVAERLRVIDPETEARPNSPVEAAWKRYRLATLRHLEAGEEREKARIEFEELFLAAE